METPPKRRKTQLTIRIPDEIIKAIDKRIDGVQVQSRSHLITLILKQTFLKWAKWEAEEKDYFSDDLSTRFYWDSLNKPLLKKELGTRHAFKNKKS